MKHYVEPEMNAELAEDGYWYVDYQGIVAEGPFATVEAAQRWIVACNDGTLTYLTSEAIR